MQYRREVRHSEVVVKAGLSYCGIQASICSARMIWVSIVHVCLSVLHILLLYYQNPEILGNLYQTKWYVYPISEIDLHIFMKCAIYLSLCKKFWPCHNSRDKMYMCWAFSHWKQCFSHYDAHTLVVLNIINGILLSWFQWRIVNSGQCIMVPPTFSK